MQEEPVKITLLGSSGGLAKSILAILNQSAADTRDPIHSIIRGCTLHLIDINQQKPAYYSDLYPHLFSRMQLHQLDLADLAAFRKHLSDTGTKVVIDVSWADTLDMLGCCNDLGIAYVNTALENTEVDKDTSLYGFPLAERVERFERKKQTFNNTTAVICSGMNPGVVQWMAMKLRKEKPEEKPLACYIVEHDNSFFTDRSMIQPKTVYTSWSVECFLDEAILSYPMFVRYGIPMYLYEEVYSAEYCVTIADKTFYGCLMPHEEVMSLGKMWDCELGFIYRVSEYTTDLIRQHLNSIDELWDWKQQIIEPCFGQVDGEDLVGVLMVYENEEKFIYNTMSSQDTFDKYRTNATYLQVACGLYASLASLLMDSLPLGAHYVEELLQSGVSNYERYLTYYMKDFVQGTNTRSDGLLHQRRREIT